ncbi:MAG: PadR family transcriptional regulator [Ktedonobacterales bacterium]
MSLKFGILGLLSEESLHGYEVKNRFDALLGHTWEVNIGQVYSTLQRLERDNLVESIGERGDRGKLAYQVTPEGRQALDHWLSEPEAEPQHLHDDLFIKLMLIRRLANGNMQGLINKQRRLYLQRLRDLAELERRARAEGRPDLLLLIKGAVIHTEADIKWLDVCLDELASLQTYHPEPDKEQST